MCYLTCYFQVRLVISLSNSWHRKSTNKKCTSFDVSLHELWMCRDIRNKYFEPYNPKESRLFFLKNIYICNRAGGGLLLNNILIASKKWWERLQSVGNEMRRPNIDAHVKSIVTRASPRNNILNALADTKWGQKKETILITYMYIGDNSHPKWEFPNGSPSLIQKLQIM